MNNDQCGDVIEMITVTLQIMATPQRRVEIMRTLRSISGPTQAEPGCACCHSYQDIEDNNAFFTVQEWKTQMDLNRYIRSDQFRKILALMEISSEPPEIKINTISHTAGFETIKAARG
jgi:quinol monooxygenase YgiN